MQIRSVIKLGVILSVVLFCIGIAFYGFARLSMADKENSVDVFEFVPMQDFSETWTDEKLYKKYKLKQDEIDFIATIVKKMDSSDE